MRRHIRLTTLIALTALLSSLFMTGTASAREAVTNGDFELGEAYWTSVEYPAGAASVSGAEALSGSLSAAFCAEIDGECSGMFMQGYSVPEGVTSAVLTYSYFADTSDTEANCDDLVAVGFHNFDSSEREMDAVCSENAVRREWTQRTFDVTHYLAAREGQGLYLIVGGSSAIDNRQEGIDASHTNWYVDDVSLDVTVRGVARTITLDLRRHLIATGTVGSDGYAPCQDGVVVKIQKKRSDGTWRTVESTRTADDGTYRKRLPADAAGKYRAKAPAFEPFGLACAGAKSATKAHQH